MKHFLFTLVKIYPAWAIPLSFVSYELGLYFKRRGSRLFLSVWGVGVFLVLFTLLWLGFRGDLNSDDWVRTFLQAW